MLQVHGIFLDQVYRLVAHKAIANLAQSVSGEGGAFPFASRDVGSTNLVFTPTLMARSLPKIDDLVPD